MLYVDTSAVVPFFVNEAASEDVRRWFSKQALADIAISLWTTTEFASAMGIRTRTGTLDPASAHGFVEAFRTLVRQSITLLPVTAADFEFANELVLRFELGLRGGDALHLAIAGNAGADTIVTLDRKMREAVERLSWRCEIPG